MTIPATCHFVWFGHRLPWVYQLAIKTAADRGGYQRVILHHADDLNDTCWWPPLLRATSFETHRLDPELALASCLPYAPGLLRLFRSLTRPADRSNVIRAALLYRDGGVYLDTDTVSLASAQPLLRGAGIFCGEEHIVFPHRVRRSRRPEVQLLALGRTALRDLLRRVPSGWRIFRGIQGLYPRGVSNAVLGCAPGHPLVGQILEEMTRLAPLRRIERYATGTHLLQRVVARYRAPDLRICSPQVFYPLGPEISECWFRDGRPADLERILSPETRIVHWYASVRLRDLVPRITPEYVRAHADRQLFSAMVAPFLES